MANTTADKLALLASNKAAIKAAINAKSPATAPTDVMSQWPTAIASIEDDWHPDPSWPDLRSIVKNDTGLPDHPTYTNKVGILYYCDARLVTFIKLYDYCIVKFQDGTVYNGSAEIPITSSGYYWLIVYSESEIYNLPKPNNSYSDSCIACMRFIVGGDNSIIVANNYYTQLLYQEKKLEAVENVTIKIIGNRSIGSAAAIRKIDKPIILGEGATSNSNVFSGDFSLKNILIAPYVGSVVPNHQNVRHIDLGGSTISDQSYSAMFSGRFVLSRIDGVTFDFSTTTNTSSMFNRCYCLEELPFDEVNAPVATNMSNMFNLCTRITKLPSIVAPNCTNASNIVVGVQCCIEMCESFLVPLYRFAASDFAQNYSLVILPKYISVADGSVIDFSPSKYVSADSIAKFDGNGYVNGGLAYTITPATTGSTIKFNTEVRTRRFPDATKVAKIEQAFAAKNWTVAW